MVGEERETLMDAITVRKVCGSFLCKIQEIATQGGFHEGILMRDREREGKGTTIARTRRAAHDLEGAIPIRVEEEVY